MRYSQSTNIVTRTIGEETILVPINQTGVSVQKIYSLNDTAKSVWEAIQEPKDINEIVQELISRYQVDDVTLMSNEVISLLDELREFKFVDLEI